MLSPISHTAVLKFKPAVSEQEKLEFFKALKNLESISGVQKLEISKQISTKNHFEYFFSMIFDTQEIYDAYSNHSLHNEFVQTYWIPLVEDFMEIDTIKI
ncbi:Dabb family protein [Sandaracinomonas limnophila]|uniref:Dabb family protein n=1 Tax=Sandaracinomonas limnophila TaxID=1862386 RepID=A0A437PTC7_9BACT|nr:Dabb family protein [Sandaracinomonas limnophila]RVU25523.1 Dabb family protein [Sandaracinomonas limnophila]